MASWQPFGGKGPPKGPSQAKAKKERWLVTRKTWRYMADAGKLLIPDALLKGKDPKAYTEEDLRLLEEHYQNVCEQQREFIIWEGPVEDPRVALAKNRKAPSLSTDAESESHDSSDFRFESHSEKFHIVLPAGQKPPPGYQQDDWSYDSSLASPLESGFYSPSDLHSPRSHSPCSSEGRDPRESGIGSGADSVLYRQRSMSVQTDPLPAEFFLLQEEEQRQEEERRRREEEEERLASIAEETAALARKEARRNSAEGDAMGDTVMRYLKMVRRNSKTADHKKAERFRSMNYDPTLRNIKSKYVSVEAEERWKHVGIQCGESLISLLKKCTTPVEPSKPKRRRVSRDSEISESIASPRYSITIADETVPLDVERDFFAHLYSGDLSGLDSGNIPEEYYTYLEAWYRSQIGAQLADMAARQGTPFSLHTAASYPPATHAPAGSVGWSGPTPVTASSGFMAVPSLAGLRTSLPAHLPQLSSGSLAGGPQQPSSALNFSRSSASLAASASQPHPSASTSSLSFLTSVMSGKGRSSVGPSAGKIFSKKVFRQRSKSQGRVAGPVIASPWSPSIAGDCKGEPVFSWHHASGQAVMLQSSTLLHLLEIERVFLQKLAQASLAGQDLATIIRIPKDTVDRGEMSKARRRAHLLKKKVLQAGSMGTSKPPPQDKDKAKAGEGAVFGIPINQCVDPSRKRSTTDIPSEEVMSPTSKSSRSDSRTSIGSIFDSPAGGKERVGSPLHSAGSWDSLEDRSRSYSIVGGSQSALDDTLSYTISCDRLDASDPSERINPLPCVPSVVNTCIRYLELHGLNTVGIFRVGSSKKRVRQLREDFDSGADVTLTDEVSVHDVATILKEFLRDLPEPLLPREVYHPLLAVQKIRNRRQQLEAMRRVTQLLPQVNRDTMYVLLNFLHLVAANSEDRKGPQGEDIQGNKMDSNNLATLFAPNILHSMKPGDGTISPESTAKAAERTETINIVRSLIDYNKELFELGSEELHQLYLRMHDEVPEAMDYQLRRRAILNGDEFVEDFEANVFYDMPEPRLIGPNEPSGEHSQERQRKKEDEQRGRARRRGSEADGGQDGKSSWGSMMMGGFKKREKSNSTGSARTPSNESVNSPSGKGGKPQMTGKIITGSLKINVAGLQSDKDGKISAGAELDVPYIEDASENRPFRTTKRVVLRRLSQDTEGKMLSCEIHLPSMKGPEPLLSPGRDSSPLGFQSGSGASTPSNPLSPPPTVATPMVFSPPQSPTALTPTPASMGGTNPSFNISVETKYLDPSCRGTQDVSLVLKPVPSPPHRRPSPAESTKTLVNESNESVPNIHIESTDFTFTDRHSPRPWATAGGRVKPGLAMSSLSPSSLSLPPDSVVPGSPSLSAAAELRSKTENLESLLTEVERQELGVNGAGGNGREVKKYIRRRYTDSRHPTTELPDVRGGMEPLPSVRDRPTDRRSKSKEVTEALGSIPGGLEVEEAPEEQRGRSPGAVVTDRQSYKRWQMSAGRNNSDSDSYV